jgi:hypothetical protein
VQSRNNKLSYTVASCWSFCKYKITTQTNEHASTLLEEEEELRRLKRFKPTDLTTRFS